MSGKAEELLQNELFKGIVEIFLENDYSTDEIKKFFTMLSLALPIIKKMKK